MARRDKSGEAYQAVIAGLVAHRKAAGLSQWDVAHALGTDQSQVSKLERGERRLDIIDYVRFCRALGLDPGTLLRLVPADQPQRKT